MGLFSSIVKGIGKVAAPVLKIGSTVAGIAGKEKLSNALGAFGDIATGERQRTDTLDLNDQAMSFQREMNEAQQKFNSAEAEKTRAFNSEEAAKQRQFEQQMYEQQVKDNREWNDIGAQLQRQMAAGLNPLGMDGETMSLGNPGTGAAANGGSPASIHPNGAPAIANPSIGIANQMADLRLKQAQAENQEAGAGKAREETIDLQALRAGKVRLQEADWNVKMSTKALNDAEQYEIAAKIELAVAQASKLAEDITRAKIERTYLPAYLDAQTKETLARAGLANKQADLVYQQIQAQIKNNELLDIELEMAVEGKPVMLKIQQKQNGLLEFFCDKALEYKDEVAIAVGVKMVCDTFGDVIDKGLKAIPKKGVK